MGLKKELYGPLHESPFVQCKSIYFTLNLGLREGMGGEVRRLPLLQLWPWILITKINKKSNKKRIEPIYQNSSELFISRSKDRLICGVSKLLDLKTPGASSD